MCSGTCVKECCSSRRREKLRSDASTSRRGERGSFGMLAVDPSRQGAGLGRRLIDAAEQHIRDAGGRAVDIHVVNLRTDLLPRYRRRGYVDIGTAPYVHRPTIQPCHFVVMRKRL